jgi:hypothetical protein
MENKDKIILKGECTGNNDNGCFMESPGHDCGCFKRMYSEEEVIKIVEKSRETGLTAEYLLLTKQFKKK